MSALMLVACGNKKDDSAQTDSPEKDNIEHVATEDSDSKEKTATFKYEVNQDTWQIVPLKDSNASEKVALLTFDDTPDKHGLEIAQKLDKLGVPAIFFVNAMFLDRPGGEEMLKGIHKLGFEIGNHTYNHPDLTTLSYEEQLKEIKGVNDRVEEIIGLRPRFLRPPFGLFNETTLKIMDEEKMTIMNWTYGYDWEEQYQNGAALADIMVNTEFLSSGANLLMHDRSWTLDAQEGIISGLRDKGYTFVDPAEIISKREMNN